MSAVEIPMYKDIMVDLETMGTKPGSVILSIGAVSFHPVTGLGDSFYVEISRQSCALHGLTEDTSTVEWWSKQGATAKRVLEERADKLTLTEALSQFQAWLLKRQTETGKAKVRVWGNGSDFDNVLLNSAYSAIGAELPWAYWDNRCYRTLKGLMPLIKMQRKGTHHNALDDAISQAEHTCAILSALSNPAEARGAEDVPQAKLSSNWHQRFTLGAGGFLGEVTLLSLSHPAAEDAQGRYDASKTVLLTDLFVHPLRRRKGWATELLYTATKYADRRGLDIVLWVNGYGVGDKLPDSKLFALYRQYGFKRIGRSNEMVRKCVSK